MSRVNSAIRPSPAMVDISTESYTHEGGLWLGCFWFHYPYQKCEGKEECKFSESHSNFRKTNFGKRQFCAKSHRPIKYCNNFRICKKKSASPTSQAHILHTSWSTFEVQRGPGHYQGHSLQRTKSLLSAVVDQAALASAWLPVTGDLNTTWLEYSESRATPGGYF